MIVNKQHLWFAIAGLILGLVVGFFFGKGMYQSTPSIKVKRDTIITHDTIPFYFPSPKDSATIRYVTKYLPKVEYDTLMIAKVTHDTVAVQVPITSKHYGAKEYDAWVSGFEPSLDSIKVYQEKEYITEKVTITKKERRKPFGLGFSVGYGYDFKTKTAAPYVGVGLSYDILSF